VTFSSAVGGDSRGYTEVKQRRSISMSYKRKLTSRERQVLDLLVEGASNRIIAHKLGITEATIKPTLLTSIASLGSTPGYRQS
jgi:DNA-binding NarL/FixJ family response regulator